MKIHIRPHSDLGLWSIVLMFNFFFISFFTVFVTINIFHQNPGNSMFHNPYISIPMIVAFWAAITSFFSGIISIRIHKERSILVLISVILGFLIAWYLLGDLTIKQ